MKNESKKPRVGKSKNKIQRSDSITAQTKIAQGAHKEIKPPAHIRMEPADMPFFESVIDEFARAVWTNHQIEMAALLARTMCQMEHEQYLLRLEGAVSKTEKGTPVVNPRKTVVQQCAGTILAMRRSLSLHARAQAGEKRDVAKRRVAEKELEQATDFDDEGLIARPSVN